MSDDDNFYLKRMGAELRAEVERQLLADLLVYGVKSDGLHINWSDACQEGHMTEYMGGVLEDYSGINVLDTQQNAVAEGWLDFIHGGDENPLFVFWLFLRVVQDNEWKEVKCKNHIPHHIWDKLPDSSKLACTTYDMYDARWCKDPLVIEWKHSLPLESQYWQHIKEHASQFQQANPELQAYIEQELEHNNFRNIVRAYGNAYKNAGGHQFQIDAFTSDIAWLLNKGQI